MVQNHILQHLIWYETVCPSPIKDARLIWDKDYSSQIFYAYFQARGVDYIVLWLDCDKEGENICFEVLDCVQGVMNRNVPGQVSRIYRYYN